MLLHVDRGALVGVVAEWHRILRPGGVVGFATSLASTGANNEGWEVVPAGPDRRPEIADGEQRWFVHHQRESLLEAVRLAGWAVTWTQEIESYRTWIQVLAQKP